VKACAAWLIVAASAANGADVAAPPPAAEPALAVTAGAVAHVRGEYRFHVGPVPEFVVRRDVPDAWDTDIGREAGDPWRGWLYDRQIDFRAGRRVEFADYAYEVLTTSMLGEAGRFEASFNPLFQTLTLHGVQVRRDGTWQNRLDPARVELVRREVGFDDDKSDGLVSALLVLDDVRVGDVVRLTYSVTGENPIMGGHVLAQWATAASVPMLRRSLRAVFDRDADPVVGTRGGADAAAVESRVAADGRVLEARLSAIPAVVDTRDYPTWYMPYPLLQLSARRTWADVVDWARPLYPTDAPLPPDLQRRVEAWRSLPKAEAIAAATRVAQEEVRYFAVALGDNTHRPNLPAVVWARRYGDCKDKALLLASMLRELGIDAVPALVSFEDGAGVRESLPAANAFDHVIVRARADGRTLWLDATMTQQRGDVLVRDLPPYGVALPIAPGVTALEDVVAPKDVDTRVHVVESFAPDAGANHVDLEVVTDYAGSEAVALRRDVQARRFERIAEGYADYYRRRYGDIEVLSPPTLKDDEAGNTIRTVERYRLRDPWNGDGERVLVLAAVPLAAAVELPSAVRRNAPLAIDARAVRRYEAKVTVPEGWMPQGSLGVAEYEGGPFHYTREVVRAADEVAIVQELTTTADHVAAADIPHYVEAVRRTRSETALRVVLAPVASSRPDERADRLESLLRDTLEGQ
jgi:hypothetical protein